MLFLYVATASSDFFLQEETETMFTEERIPDLMNELDSLDEKASDSPGSWSVRFVIIEIHVLIGFMKCIYKIVDTI